MILETTYSSKENKELINDLVGKPFSFLQNIRMGGIGSKRMIIDKVSPSMRQVLNTVSDLNYGNIELRPKGILLSITKGLRNFTWVVPYYQFYMYHTPAVSIHAQGKFVLFKNNRTHRENEAFFKKLQRLKAEYDQQYPHVDSIDISTI
ncbi:hypothetical protein [Aquimarina brevivitae]|uniref:Uncharacterized protein n=1 Tax=Aquimarina brevivitae TaxID=323412 RepID=A0A4Q7P3C8_9FLAO|nr:hypothetical protein [Aquimarina brevivitae]RZS93878.1 hypothetical protein EV197_2459 [Aquimarina brevivitae]